MDTKLLEDFLVLAETRSFSRAALERHITQSAFSRRIMTLETWLGVSLVDRSVQPTTLTSAGWVFRRIAADLVRDAYAARTLLSGYHLLSDPACVVQFAVAHTLLFTYFPNWLKHLQDRFGALTSGVMAVNVPEGVQQLVDDKCDMMLGYHHPHLPILLDANRVPFLLMGIDRILPYSTPDQQGRPLFSLPGTSDNPLPFMAYSSGAFLGNIVEMVLLNSPTPYHLRRSFETHMSEAIKAMVVAGHGVGWLPESCVVDEVREGKLVMAGSAEWSTNLEVRLYRSSVNPKPIVKQLWTFIASDLSNVQVGTRF